MRLSNVSLLTVLCMLSVTQISAAAPTVLVDKTVAEAKDGAVTIVPHRAIYDMALSSIKNGTNINDVSGKMIFEWSDACDGWAIQQNLQLHINYAQGDGSNIVSNQVTWESKDGKHYNFNLRRLQDGKEAENFRGKANMDSKEAKAVYTMPEGKAVSLTSNTIFPSSHTRLILEKATTNDHFFSRHVFDGTDGADDVSVFIGNPIVKPLDASTANTLDANPLLAATAWPVHMAFFKLTAETGAPDYEMDLTLLSNGISKMMKIDYGDFSVTGTLQAVEPLPAPHC